MAERGSNPISPRTDDEMKHELEGHLRSGRPAHVEEASDPEPPADDDIRVDPGGPVPPPGEERDRARAEAEADSLRLELARHLDRTAFPADRRSVLDALEAHHAPDPVLEAARGLPEDGTYADVTGIVEALGHRPTR
ncbi:DUF2795 domain-containing protein [Streptomyces griseomycini]|uniref:DUF2795 domain-containing protein n=1 Tax=Streptomyces griseomycini TaxID=66895 RepID=A0A7W7PRJ3_9ACTN|nr:DUF2795 domain-containing protein [Streptomyces griseomycini]MBB4899704.1 hypothetical protein [Streptomyces griseomycini]GGP97504.1 hypothetical protein GCM10010266_20970 [Streptomyces griseomycini]GGR07229.1 hypothetical protein GCM10015536_10330 [Streptomyces griseomycini]